MAENIIEFPVKRITPLYQLKVTLAGTKPPIWRRLVVVGNIPLDLLHVAIQLAMGWTNSHLHEFRLADNTRYSDPQFGFDSEMSVSYEDESAYTLMQLVPKSGMSFSYLYDYGDSWEHAVVVEKILSPDETFGGIVLCTGGARACPPENCGGVGQYERLLQIQKEPLSGEYQELVIDWLGGPIDAEAFSLDACNRRLKRLKGEHLSPGQIRRIFTSQKRAVGLLESEEAKGTKSGKAKGATRKRARPSSRSGRAKK